VSNSTIKLKGKVVIKTWDLNNGDWKHRPPDRVNEYENLTTTDGMEILLKKYMAEDSGEYIRWLGVGTGTTTVTASDTEIENEIYRQLITSHSYSIPSLVLTFYFAQDEAVGNWGNLGLILSDGTLLTHVNITESKSSSEVKTVTYTITLSN